MALDNRTFFNSNRRATSRSVCKSLFYNDLPLSTFTYAHHNAETSARLLAFRSIAKLDSRPKLLKVALQRRWMITMSLHLNRGTSYSLFINQSGGLLAAVPVNATSP